MSRNLKKLFEPSYKYTQVCEFENHSASIFNIKDKTEM